MRQIEAMRANQRQSIYQMLIIVGLAIAAGRMAVVSETALRRSSAR